MGKTLPSQESKEQLKEDKNQAYALLHQALLRSRIKIIGIIQVYISEFMHLSQIHILSE